jgi:hypothetical protein
MAGISRGVRGLLPRHAGEQTEFAGCQNELGNARPPGLDFVMEPSKPTGNTAYRKPVGAFLLGIVIAGLAFLLWPESQKPKTPAPAVAPLEAATNVATTARPAEPKADFGGVVGKWLREDGGYVLEIKSAGSDGKLEAAYFNPNPIRVSRAAATREGDRVKVEVELNDTGYPGCVYKLQHERAQDQLVGTYFQAALEQTFDVVFVRMK